MNSVQFDECFTSKRIHSQCEEEKKVAIKTFPHRLRNKSVKDPEVVDRWSATSESLVTTDHRMPGKQAHRIPDPHAGIIVVRHNGPHTQREKDIVQVLGRFKALVPNWQTLDVTNSVVELYQDRVEVYSVKGGKTSVSTPVSFSQADFLVALISALSENAQKAIGSCDS